MKWKIEASSIVIFSMYYKYFVQTRDFRDGDSLL